MSSYASKNIRPQYRQVVIVGAGVSGIAMACMLRKKLGVEDFVILDKEPAPAGSECGSSAAGRAGAGPATKAHPPLTHCPPHSLARQHSEHALPRAITHTVLTECAVPQRRLRCALARLLVLVPAEDGLEQLLPQAGRAARV